MFGKMDKLLEKKKKSGEGMLSDNEKNAKMGVLQDLRNQASQAMGGKLKDLKKVTVASNDENGLKAGLDKAKEIIDQKRPGFHEADDGHTKHSLFGEGTAEEEMEESPEEEASEMHAGPEAHQHALDAENGKEPAEGSHLDSPEAIDLEIEKLRALKDKLFHA